MTWRSGRAASSIRARWKPCRKNISQLLKDSVKLRFRSDVPVGINVSGGLDSSILAGPGASAAGRDSNIEAFTYVTGDPNYDELPWVKKMLEGTRHPSIVYQLDPAEVPDSPHPFSGIRANHSAACRRWLTRGLFDRARAHGVTVVMDGQGMDEQWAGYDYYSQGHEETRLLRTLLRFKGRSNAPRARNAFRRIFALWRSLSLAPHPFPDALRNRQYPDTRYTKMPKALRFNDRISMRASVELREPFLDHRLFELALRQPVERKIENGTRKKMLRNIARHLSRAPSWKLRSARCRPPNANGYGER